MTTRLVEAYRAAGGRAELEVFPGVGHSFANFPGDAAQRCIERMRLFISRELTALGDAVHVETTRTPR